MVVQVTHDLHPTSTSLHLPFLLVYYMTWKELVLFTTTSGWTFLFDPDDAAGVMTKNLADWGYLPDFVDSVSLIWSLVDCVEQNKLVFLCVSLFVAALSPDESLLLPAKDTICSLLADVVWSDDHILTLRVRYQTSVRWLFWTRLTPVSLRTAFRDAGFVLSPNHGRSYWTQIDAAVASSP